MKPARALEIAAVTVATGLLLAACSSGSSSGSAATTPTAEASGFQLTTVSPSTGAASAPGPSAGSATTAAGPTSATASPISTPAVLRYQKIVEPFSPPGTCNENGSTLEITDCVLEQVLDVDSTVDQLQQSRFERARASQQPGILKEYATWLKGRSTTCAKKATTGGSIDQITVAQCLLQQSQDRVETLNDVG